MDIAPEFKKFAQEHLGAKQPGSDPQPAGPAEKKPVEQVPPSRKPAAAQAPVRREARSWNMQTGQKPAAPISSSPAAVGLELAGYKPCLKCGLQDREDRMFSYENGHVCKNCYNPYIHKVSSRDFYAKLGNAFAYPFRGNNIIMLITGTLFFGLLTFFARLSAYASGAVGLVGSGFLFEFLFSIILSSASGSDDLPDWPDFGIGKVCIAGIQYLCATILPLVPALVWFFLFVRTGCGGPVEELALILASPTATSVVFLLLLVAGAFLIPAATVSVSMATTGFGSLIQISPHNLVPMILKAPLEYVIISCVLILVMTLQAIALTLCTQFGGTLIGSVISVPFTLYFLFVEMRMLGLFWRLANKRMTNEELWEKFDEELSQRRKQEGAYAQ